MTQKSLFKTSHPRQSMFWRGYLLCIYHFWVSLSFYGRVNFVCAEVLISGSPAKVGGQKTRFRSSLNSTVVLNLDCSLVFFFNSFFLYFFEKSTKNGAVVYGIRCFLCSRVALRHLSVGAHLAGRYLSQCLGRQELAALKHHATCFQALLGYSLCLPTLPFRPWRGITFAKKIH